MNDHQAIINAYLDDELTESQYRDLVTWIRSAPHHRKHFVTECYLHSHLQDIFLGERAARDASDSDPRDGEAVSLSCPAGVFSIHPSAGPTSPAMGLAAPLGDSPGHFLSGWPVAYLIATAIFGVGLLIGALVHVSQPSQIVHQPSTDAKRSFDAKVQENRVGRITGMVDCRLSESSADASVGASVLLGRKFILRSGLMELTYETGAKVILQGPVTYEVESPSGGYLAIGKLTAKLEKTSEFRRQRSTNQKSEIQNHKSFSVRTPTALVTDLGTEFGVEVRSDGTSDVVVLQGQVQVMARGVQGDADTVRSLQAGQSAQIHSKSAEIVVVHALKESSNRFVRALPTPVLPQGADVTAGDHLVLWLKADAIRGRSDGDPVAFWNDSSGKRNHMYRASANAPTYISGANSGLNNMAVVRFDGTRHLRGVLDADSRAPGVQALATPMTLFSVVRNADRNSNRAVRGYFGGGPLRLAFGFGRHPDFVPKNSFWAWTPYAFVTFGQTDSLNANWNVHAYAISDLVPHDWTWYCNGTPAGSIGLETGSAREYEETVYVGSTGCADEHWVGDVAELLLYGRVLTANELNAVGEYLAKKYGLNTNWNTSEPIVVDQHRRDAGVRKEAPMNTQ